MKRLLIKSAFIFLVALMLGVSLVATLASYPAKPVANSLRIHVQGRTHVVRHPFASGYQQGDVVDFVDVDGVHYNGVVVNPILLDVTGEPTEDLTPSIQ